MTRTQAEQTDRATVTVDAQPGEFVASNLKASNPLIKVEGARIAARDQAGNAFLEIDDNAKPGAAKITVTAAHPFPVVAGRIVTLLGLLGLATVAVVLFRRRRRRHHRAVLRHLSATTADAPGSVSEPTRAQAWWSSRWLTVVAGVALAGLVIGICLWTMLHEKRFVVQDWFLHEWYVWHQEGSLRAHGLPSLFAQDAAGVFDPHYAFYGGTLYTISGVIALVTGHHAAYLVTWVLAFAMAYGGWFWLARQAGLGPWASHAPRAWCSSRRRGSSARPTSSGAGRRRSPSARCCWASPQRFSILRADRLRPLPALALAVAVVLYTGSHNLTLLWATTVLAHRRARGLHGRSRHCARCSPAGDCCASRSSPFRPCWSTRGSCFPPIAYQSHTVIGEQRDGRAQHAARLHRRDDSAASAHPGPRARRPAVPALCVQLPLLATAWIVAGLLIMRPKRSSPWLRTALLLLVVAVATWALMTQSSIINGLPHPYDMLQNALRLEAYINLAIAGALIATLVLTRRAGPRRRWWAWALAGILVVSVVQARQQVREPLTPPLPGPLWTSMPYLTSARPPAAAPATADYTDARVPALHPGPPPQERPVPPSHGRA